MNVPTLALLDPALIAIGGTSTMLGGAKVGLIKAPFTPTVNLKWSDVVEADYSGYDRESIGNPSIPFTGGDGKRYVEGLTVQFMPSDTVTPNTIYGLAYSPASDSTKICASDVFTNPIFLSGPGFQITITPRFALDPLGNYGLNVISN